jgi:hypothetical protein
MNSQFNKENEIQISEEFEPKTAITAEEVFSSIVKSTTNIKEKNFIINAVLAVFPN